MWPMARRSTEIKVGILILVCMGLLAGFVFILGNFSLSKGMHFYVDFQFVGNLAEGAPVKVSGIKVGKIKEIQFHAGKYDDKLKRRIFVRLKVWVEDRAAKAIRTDSNFYINTQGMLGEQYLEITPGNLDDKKSRQIRPGEIRVGEEGQEIRFTLVAGLIARRIVCRVRPGERLEAGDRVGVIRFGSRVDVFLPEGADPAVVRGQSVLAGETVIARLRAREAPARQAAHVITRTGS